jgi:hypothetical protein
MPAIIAIVTTTPVHYYSFDSIWQTAFVIITGTTKVLLATSVSYILYLQSRPSSSTAKDI